MLRQDEWLSQNFFPKGAYLYEKGFDTSMFPTGFFWAKISSEDIFSLRRLLTQGFILVETLLTFYQENISSETRVKNSCRLAKLTDKEDVLKIAGKAFTHARFFKDPHIPFETACRIKQEWTANYFLNQRGNHMVVYQGDKGVEGFLLLLNRQVDLIAVREESRGKGIAGSMIAYANDLVGHLKAGTQSTNAASINLYQKMGFLLNSAQFVLHKHVYTLPE